MFCINDLGNNDIIIICNVGVEKIEHSEHPFGFPCRVNKI